MNNSDAIAVIGMSCRFPGARNIDEFWDNLKNGVESISFFTDQELIDSGVHPSEFSHPDYVRSGFIIEDEDVFDASFFGYSPKEAEMMDPQQRIFLETAWEALEDGGYATEQHDLSVGVFAGARMSSYLINVINSPLTLGNPAHLQTIIANDKDFLTSRVSFKLNLDGPSITVQSACSTSLVAVHMACESLFTGACDMALAGGISLNFPQKAGYLFQDGLVFSPDGHCRVFDAGASGMVPGNGAGVVLLKRLEDAIADHDSIHGIIIGSAVNNDGSQKIGYTAPSVEGQVRVIREALGISGVDPGSISYIEAHGTGTNLGDPVEIRALDRVFRAETDKQNFCAIGSVKTNIGHLDTAAGIAGFIKAVLSLKHRSIVPSLNYSRPNSKINFENSPFFVNTALSEWKTNGTPRRAGVSSFGFGGTNAHVILEQAPERTYETRQSNRPMHLLTLSAKTPDALKRQIRNYGAFLEKNNDLSIDDICFTANASRAHFQYRFAAIADSTDNLRLQLSTAMEKKTSSTLFEGAADNQVEPEVTFDLSSQSFINGQLIDIGSDSHLLQASYKLPLSNAGKDDYLLILSALGKLYVLGANIDWKSFYYEDKPKRIPLPTYPFEPKRYWYPGPSHGKGLGKDPFIGKESSDQYSPDTVAGHSLLGKRIYSPASAVTFENNLQISDLLPSLRDHRIFGEILAPGGYLFEIALAAGKEIFQTQAIALKNVMMHEALVFEETDHPVKLQAIVSPDPDKSSFEIYSTSEPNPLHRNHWKLHFSGNFEKEVEDRSASDKAFAEILQRCTKPIDLKDLYKRAGQTNKDSIDGAVIQELKCGNHEAIGRIEFQEDILKEAEDYKMPPAFLDPCLHVWTAVLQNTLGDDYRFVNYLPLAADYIRYYASAPEQFWCHVAVRDLSDEDNLTGDITLYNMSGEVIARITEMYLRPVSPEMVWESRFKKLSYEVSWDVYPEHDVAEPESSIAQPGRWLLLGDKNGTAENLSAEIGRSEDTDIIIFQETNPRYPDAWTVSDFEQLLNDEIISRHIQCKGIVYMWALDDTVDQSQLTSNSIRQITRYHYFNLVHLIRAIVSSNLEIPRLSIVTRNAAHLVVPDDPSVSVSNSVLWGMRKVINQEHPELNSMCMDLGSKPSGNEGLALWEQLRINDNETEIALRDNRKYVSRLVRANPVRKEVPDQNSKIFSSDSTYLITGGFGGMGLETARWLSENGVDSIVLLGRHAPSPSTLAAIEQIRESDITIKTRQVDIGDQDALKGLVQEIKATMPPLKGVFHIAGVLQEGDILRQKSSDMELVMAPKMEGAWNLHLLTLDSPLEHFVMFSSISSLFGGHGLGAYTASNAFLDALASYRKTQGLPALSVNWGAFSKVGMITQDVAGTKMREKAGIDSFDPREALSHLLIAMGYDLNRICLAKMRWSAFLSQGTMLDNKFFNCLGSEAATAGTPSIKKDVDFLSQLALSSGNDRNEQLKDYLKDKVSKVLRMDKADLADDTDLIQMGMDSLIFLELSQTLSKELQVEVTPHKLFREPTIRALANHFAQVIGKEKGQKLKSDIAESFLLRSDPEHRFEPFELTDIQQAYWVGRLGVMGMGKIACHTYYEIDVNDLDMDRYTRAWNTMINRHEMLRVVVLPDGQQKILENVPEFRIKISDFINRDLEFTKSQLSDIRKRMSHQVFRTEDWPLFEVSVSQLKNNISRVHMSLDLLFADAHSIRLILNELHLFYNNPELTLDTPAISFRDYVVSEKDFRRSAIYERAKSYWLNRLENLPKAPDLPMIKQLQDIDNPLFKRKVLTIESDIWQNLKKRASISGITPAGLLLTAYAKILSLWSKSNRFSINVTVFNRLPVHPQINEIVGDFTSVIFLEIDASSEASFEKFAVQTQNQLWRDMEHRFFSGVQFLRELAQSKNNTSMDIMPVVFTSNLVSHMDNEDENMFSLAGSPVYGISQTPQVWMDLQVAEINGELVVFLDTVEDLFPEGMPDDMFHAYHSLLNYLADAYDAWHAGNFNLLPESQTVMRKKYNATKIPVPNRLLHTLFFDQADRNPDKEALITTEKRMSYKELALWAMLIGQRLQTGGVKPNELVAVVMDKGWEQISAVLGVLYSGAAYLPVDPTVPKERLWHLLKNSEVGWVLTQSWLDEKLDWPDDVKRLSVDTDTENGIHQDMLSVQIKQTSDDLAYVIYTSGSTGLPKGVMVDHKSAVNTILDINRRFHVTSEDVVFALSNLNFDLSVYDIFGTLAAGGTIVLPDNSLKKDPAHWLALIKQEGVSVWNSVPALMEMLVESVSGECVSGLETLRLSLLSGDWIPLDLPEKIKALASEVDVVSLGGATEASIWSICYPIRTIESHWVSIPYGYPLDNQQLYVLNAGMELCPDWVTGEIYIGGTGLAKGYWRDEEKTRNAFICHPRTGERLYRTGDLGRYLPNGCIEFLGREDFQVKISGYRIELGEIEAHLIKHPRIRNAVISVPAHEHPRLVGYLVLTSGADLNQDEIEAYLEQKLPEYMIPRTYVFLDELPLTNNGKIDRKALPTSQLSNLLSTQNSIPPRTETERAVADIWSNILDIHRPGIHDNFFLLGGDSMLATRSVFNLQNHFSITMPLPKFFELPTIAEQARYIEEALIDPATFAKEIITIRDLANEVKELVGTGVLPKIIDFSGIDKPKAIFLTGSTGFLGSFLLKELLTQTRAKIYCLVRSKDEGEGGEKIRESLAKYELFSDSLDLQRVIPVPGDLSKPFLGLPKETFQDLSGKLDSIYHNGAQTDFLHSYDDLKSVNVMGTLEILKMATKEKIKPLHYISTTAVFLVDGRQGGRTVFESDGLIEEGILHGGYSQSKWVAEKLVRTAMSRGLPGAIYRPGIISSDSRTGQANTSDMVCRMLKGCLETGLVPKVNLTLNFLPVDFVSRSIVYLSLRKNDETRIFHLVNPNTVETNTVVDWIRAFGFHLESVPYEKWLNVLKANDSRDNAIYPLLSILPGSIPEGQANTTHTTFDIGNTRSAIADGGMNFPPLDEKLFIIYLSHFIRSGYVQAPTVHQ